MKKTIQLTVNASAVTAEVEPRLQLADFLRDHLLLTGTHVGCEHGVCGACTVEIDGAPARACIAYAVTLAGARVRTIEGFDDDPVMAELREAFSAEHALQCGYCTPGMLVTARDIVLRLPEADEARIRKELAGNLCRCTGYVGIVRAIQRVLAERGARTGLNDSERDQRAETQVRREPAALQSAAGAGAREVERLPAAASAPVIARAKDDRARSAQPTLHESFTVNHPRDQVRDLFGRLGDVTSCLPGTTLIGVPSEDHVDIRLRVKVGPIVAEFEGAADAEREEAGHTGSIRGSARDTRSSSTTRGEIRYALVETSPASTRVDVDVSYTLTGPLAQFSRSSIVQDIARRMTAAFAHNLEARLNERAGVVESQTAPPRSVELDAGSILFSVLWSRIKSFFRSRSR